MEMKEIGGTGVRLAGDAGSPVWVVQIVDPDGLREADETFEALEAMGGGKRAALLSVPVRSWQKDLTPWSAPPVFDGEPFGDGADATLDFLTHTLLPGLEEAWPGARGARRILCGYSLAGLFSLYAAYVSRAFDGYVCASPSVWYPGWTDYAASRPLPVAPVYLSLGDREEKTRNPVMRTVGEAIRTQAALLEAGGVRSVMEWNPGNHFADSGKRCAKGILWTLGAMEKTK